MELGGIMEYLLYGAIAVVSVLVGCGLWLLLDYIDDRIKWKNIKKSLSIISKQMDAEREKEMKQINYEVYSWDELKKLLKENKEIAFLDHIVAHHLPANEYKKVFKDPVADDMFKPFETNEITIDLYYEGNDYVYFEIRKEEQNENKKRN